MDVVFRGRDDLIAKSAGNVKAILEGTTVNLRGI
jgi:hypothetical protein